LEPQGIAIAAGAAPPVVGSWVADTRVDELQLVALQVAKEYFGLEVVV
jgi:hypothetical protein